MINGVHLLIYSRDAEADRAFLRNVLSFRSIDTGEGWLIFALPPAELGVHPARSNFVHPEGKQRLVGTVLYLMCDDVRALVASLKRKRVKCARVGKASWGLYTSIPLPSGAAIGLYQPTHPIAHDRRYVKP